MLNKHFMLLIAIAFLGTAVCAPSAYAMMHPWGSGGGGGGTDGQSDAPESTSGTGDELEWPEITSGWKPQVFPPESFEALYPEPSNEPIGEPVGSAPEPLTLVLLGSALTGLGVRQWRKRKHS